MSFVARLVSAFVEEGGEVRFIALDIHRDFCEVAIAEGGAVRWAPRALTRRRWSSSRRVSGPMTRSRSRRSVTRSRSRGSSSRIRPRRAR